MNAAQVEAVKQLGLKLITLRLLGVRLGRILSPEQMQAGGCDLETIALARSDNAWTLCGDVSAQMFEALKSAKSPTSIAYRVTVLGERKQQYLVLTHQVGSMQHRFVLPLYESAVQEFLAHAVRQRVWFALANNGGDDAMILRANDHHRDLKPVLAMAKKLNSDEKDAALLGLLDAALELSRPACIPSCLDGYRVTAVSTTLIAVEGAFSDTEDGDCFVGREVA